MITLDDLQEYYKKGLIRLNLSLSLPLDTLPPDRRKAKRRKADRRISERREKEFKDYTQLDEKQTSELLLKRIVMIKRQDRTYVFDIEKQGSISVSIERGCIERKEWEKIKKQMRETGFSYRSESPWFHVFKAGKWDFWG